jgi:hypothetical protein
VEHRSFQIEAYEQSAGKWRALVRHSDWTVVRVGSTRFLTLRFALPIDCAGCFELGPQGYR